jgi:imidazolonepropionase-like amidohydrolase
MRKLVVDGFVLDGTGAPAARADVAIEDGRIVEIGTGLDGDAAISAAGATIVPGLVDCHVHAILSSLELRHLLGTPLSYRFYEAAANLRRLLDVGITTVRDAAGADLGVKQAVEDGLIAGPRMRISVGMICQTGGHNDGWTLSGIDAASLFPSYPGVPGCVADGPDEMRRVVRRMLRSGADVIKIATSGGVMSPRDDPSQAHFRDEEIEVAVREAAAAGVHVMSHAQARAGVKAAVRCGVRSIEHGFDLDDEAIALMLDAGAFLVPTLSALRAIVEAAEAGADIDPAMVAVARETIERQMDSFTRAAAAGVRIAMGSDSGISPHGQNLRELELMVAGGLTPAQALRTATATAAELLGMGDEIGRLEPGKRADLVIVDGDPLEDLAGFAGRIRAVLKDGELVAAPAASAVVEVAA